MKRKILLLTGTLFIVVSGLICFALSFYELFDMRVYESKSPRGYGDAVFIESLSIKDVVTEFCVRDLSAKNKLLLVGDFESDDFPLTGIVWSWDGSVVATRSAFYHSIRSYSFERKNLGVFFTAAYDFKAHRRKQRIDYRTSVRPLSHQIERLLKQRGGAVTAKTTIPRSIGNWRWQRQSFRNRIS